MSGKYSKVYGKRTSSSGIQFEKLFKENSNRPSAAKSAGTVGRWGITSFTSIRSTNINGRRDESTNKKMRLDFGSQSPTISSPSKDPFLFDPDPDALQNKQMTGCPAPIVKPVTKPRKFFKSRNAEPYTAPKEETEDLHLRTSTYFSGNRRSESNYGHKTSDKYSGKKFDRGVYSNSKGSRDNRSLGSKKFFVSPGAASLGADVDAARTVDSDVTSCVNDGSSHNSVPIVQSSLKDATYLAAPVVESSTTSSKPPIRLRIFKEKGTSHLVSETQELTSAVVSPPSSYGGNGPSCSVLGGASSSSINSVGRDASPRHYMSEWTSAVETEQEGNVTSMGEVSSFSEIAEAEVKDDESSGEAEESSEAVNLPSIPQQFSTSPSSHEMPLHWRSEGDKPHEASSELPSSCSPTPPTSTFPDEAPIRIEQISDHFIPETTQEDVGETHFSSETMGPTSSVVPESSCPGPVSDEWIDINIRSSGEAEAVTTETCIVAPSIDRTVGAEEAQVETTENRTIGEVGTTGGVPRKGSIFKSRRLLSDRSGKRLALYRHKWCDEREEKDGVRGQSCADGSDIGERESDPVDGQNSSLPSGAPSASPPRHGSKFDGLPSTPALMRVTAYSHGDNDLNTPEAIMGVRCARGAKEYYTVVRNVKKAHQIQESGEFQEFNDDVEYILDALQETNPMVTRCLSAISLAAKCMEPAFRMHLRAHGTVAKFFRALHDATSDPSLGLCTATVMFVLSQDRLNMDLDRDSLELMLNLLEVDGGGMGKEGGEGGTGALDHLAGAISAAQLDKNKLKVRELCAEIQSQGHAVHLDLDNITVGHLAMETLLSLTSRRAGEWFKEELRELGGLEHIVKTVTDCCYHIDNQGDDGIFPKWCDPVLDKLRKVIRCLRILENVTHQNEENQTYLLKHGNGTLVDTLIKLYRLCDSEIPLYPVNVNTTKESTEMVLLETLISTMKVLINLTHDYNSQSYGSTLAGEREGIMEASLHCLLQVPNFVPEDKKFEILVLALALLINLVEHSPSNRKLLIASRAPCDPERVFSGKHRTAVEALIFLFCEKEAFARVEEAKTDAILDGKKEDTAETDKNAKTPEEFIEETVAKLLQKAGRHMEETLIAAYVALLLGYVVMENKEYEDFVRQYLPEGNFQAMLVVLEKFFNFMNLTASAVVSSRGIAATERVINYLRKCDSALLDIKTEGDCDSSFG